MPAGRHPDHHPLGRLEPDTWEINPDRKSYEEQLFKPEKNSNALTSLSPRKHRRTS
jgi:hypothetical protein